MKILPKRTVCIFSFIFTALIFTIFLFPGLLFADENVSLTIPPRQNDFQFSFSSSPNIATVPEDTLITYKITYGTQTSANLPTNTIIVADYSSDTINAYNCIQNLL